LNLFRGEWRQKHSVDACLRESRISLSLAVARYANYDCFGPYGPHVSRFLQSLLSRFHVKEHHVGSQLVEYPNQLVTRLGTKDCAVDADLLLHGR
jgi:hypothetical protein